jgi:hypothetical protein
MEQLLRREEPRRKALRMVAAQEGLQHLAVVPDKLFAFADDVIE